MSCCDDVAGFCPFAVDAFLQALFPVSGRTSPSSQGGGDKDRAIVALSTVHHEQPHLFESAQWHVELLLCLYWY